MQVERRHKTLVITASIAVLCFLLPCLSQAEEATIQSFTEPVETVRVAFSQPGKLQKLNVAEGEQVEAGKILATLDEGALGVMFEIAEVRSADQSPVHAAQAEVDSLTQRVTDLKELVDSGGSSTAEVRRVSTDLEIAAAKLQSAQREQEINALEVRRLAAERQKYELPAPIDGYVVEILKHPGEFISANDPEVLQLVKLNPLRVRFHVPVEMVEALKTGQSVEVTLPQSRQQAEGTIQRVSHVIDPESATVLVEVNIPNPESKYRSGALCLWNGMPRNSNKTSNVGTAQ